MRRSSPPGSLAGGRLLGPAPVLLAFGVSLTLPSSSAGLRGPVGGQADAVGDQAQVLVGEPVATAA
jgi:hypothetical protein